MFNQIFSKKVVVPFFQFVGIIAIFTFIVFPGLTAADTIINIFSAIIGFFTMLALFYFVTTWFQKDEVVKEIAETESESSTNTKPKRKYTKKAKVTKSEYPLPPHHTTVRTPKVKQKK
jgi:amino acid permease